MAAVSLAQIEALISDLKQELKENIRQQFDEMKLELRSEIEKLTSAVSPGSKHESLAVGDSQSPPTAIRSSPSLPTAQVRKQAASCSLDAVGE